MIDQGQGAEFVAELTFEPRVVDRMIQLNFDDYRTIMKLLIVRQKDFSETAATERAHDRVAFFQYLASVQRAAHRLGGNRVGWRIHGLRAGIAFVWCLAVHGLVSISKTRTGGRFTLRGSPF
jgi:hypothetical protein